jgi:hypothetical protein
MNTIAAPRIRTMPTGLLWSAGALALAGEPSCTSSSTSRCSTTSAGSARSSWRTPQPARWRSPD